MLTQHLDWGDSIKETAVGPAIWHDWVYGALSNGTLRCKPDVKVVGKGLESVQAAVDLMKDGVSATKLVIEF